MRLEHTQRGYTLLEFMLYATIFTIVMTAVYMMYSSHHTTFTRGKSEIDVHQHARVALERMAMEIRMVGYDPSTPAVIPLQGTCCGLPTTAIQTMTASEIIFIADVEGADGNAERVRYRLVGSQIQRDVQTWNAGGGGSWNAAASSDLADKVTTLSFTYLDGTDTATGTAANVRRVTIQATLQGTGGESTALYRLDTDVRLRNL